MRSHHSATSSFTGSLKRSKSCERGRARLEEDALVGAAVERQRDAVDAQTI